MATQPIFASVPKPVPDLNEIRRACKVIISGAKRGRVVEVRALKTPYGTCSGYYTDATIIQDVYNLSLDESVPNVYWTIQELKRDVAAAGVNTIRRHVETTTEDIQTERYLYIPIDCDPRRPAGTSSTETEKAYSHDVACEIRDFLSIHHGIESILADSGNGYHVLVRVDMAVSDSTVELVKKLLVALKAKFGTAQVDVDTVVYNPSRILKIYGTVARKGEHTDERPWRTSRLVEIPDELPVVSEEALRALLAEITASLPVEKAAEVKQGKSEAQRNERGLIPHGEMHKPLISVAGKLRNMGMSADSIFEALMLWADENCEQPIDEDRIRQYADSFEKYEKGNPLRDMVIVDNTPNPLAGVVQVVEEQPKEWGTPEEIDDALLPVKSFDLDFVPNCMQAFVLDTAQRMSVPVDFTGVCALAVLAGCMNRRAFVYPKKLDKKWKEAISISGALVASSGELKTPTFRAFTNILTELEIDWRKIHAEVLQKYEQEVKAIKEQNKQIKRDEGVLLDMPKEPDPASRIIVNDATPERLHQLMAKNPAGMFVFRDEMSGWVSELDKEGREGQRPLFLAAMNGSDPHSVDRIGREDEFAIMSASIFGGFQPDLLMEFLSDSRNVSDGTFARLGLLVWPDTTNLPTIDRQANEKAYLTARKVMRVLAEMGVQQVQLHFGEDAQPLFDEWFESLRLKLKAEKHPGKKSHLSKYRGLLPKLAGLLQLADLVACLPSSILWSHSEKDAAAALLGVQHIDSGHLARAIRLLDYLESHMCRVYACRRGPNQRAFYALAGLIRRGEVKDGFSIRDIIRNGYADLDTVGRVDFATDALMLKGWLREMIPDPSKRGPKTTQWEIHPSLKG
jgi:hypothetical protein